LITSNAALNLANTIEEVYAAVGIHPNESQSWDESSKSRLTELATESKIVAIGEIGLDYYRDRAPIQIQQDVFNEQLSLASELNLPVIIHNRDASGDVLQILANWFERLEKDNPQLAEHPGVLHSFSGDIDDARKATELNFFIGITGPVTYPKASDLHNTVMELSLDKILIETDAPFLTPQPKRGQRNEPSYVEMIVTRIAEIRHLSFEDIAKITTANAQRLFQW
jgi:TatD DNase family protein